MEFVDALPPGRTLGEYVIGEPIGQGGFGIVYAASHPRFGAVAIKEFFPSTIARRLGSGEIGASQPKFREALRKGVERLVSEGETLIEIGAKYRNYNIVRVLEVFEQNGTAYLVMEKLNGPTLQVAIEQGVITPSKNMVDDFVQQMTGALEQIHAAGLIHRDFNPNNIVVHHAFGSTKATYVLIDFGAVKKATNDLSDKSSNLVTTRGFSAPELYSSAEGVVTAAADLYGLAATLYWLITNQPPIDAPARIASDTIVKLAKLVAVSDNHSLYAEYKTELLQAIDQSLLLIPQARPQNIDAFRDAMNGIRAKSPAETPQATSMTSKDAPKAIKFVSIFVVCVAIFFVCATAIVRQFSLNVRKDREAVLAASLQARDLSELTADFDEATAQHSIEHYESFLRKWKFSPLAADYRVQSAIAALGSLKNSRALDQELATAKTAGAVEDYDRFLAKWGNGDFSSDDRIREAETLRNKAIERRELSNRIAAKDAERRMLAAEQAALAEQAKRNAEQKLTREKEALLKTIRPYETASRPGEYCNGRDPFEVTVYFDYNQYKLTPEALGLIREAVARAGASPSQLNIAAYLYDDDLIPPLLRAASVFAQFPKYQGGTRISIYGENCPHPIIGAREPLCRAVSVWICPR